MVGKLWTDKEPLSRCASFGPGSAVFAAQRPTELRTNPPANGTPAAASASESESATQRTFPALGKRCVRQGGIVSGYRGKPLGGRLID